MQNTKFKIRNYLFSFILGVSLFLPLVSSAGEYTAVIGTDSHAVSYEGMVPCGKCLSIDPAIAADKMTATQCGETEGAVVNTKYVSCQLCHIFVVLKGLIDFALKYIVLPVSTLLIVIGGVMFFLYAENPKQAEQAKSLLTAVIIGLVVILSSWLVIGLFFTTIGLSDFALSLTGPDKWFKITCPINLP